MRASDSIHACGCRYGTILKSLTLCSATCFLSTRLSMANESERWHWPTKRPPPPFKARWIFSRTFVDSPRISHTFLPARINSNHGFLTTSSIFVERRRALLLPANFFFCPEFVFPLLPMTPLAPLLPPVLAPVHLALALKQPMQNLARGEAALFLQRGLLHFFTLAFALAAG